MTYSLHFADNLIGNLGICVPVLIEEIGFGINVGVFLAFLSCLLLVA